MDDRLQQLERQVRGGDGPALADLARRLAQTMGPDAVEARVTALVDEADLPAAAWIPALVEAACVDGYRRGRALVFEEGDAKSKKKGREVEELQLDRHGASFGVRPAEASIVAIDEASDRELTWPSDVSPALLLRLLRDRARLELDLAEDDEPAARLLGECLGSSLKRADGDPPGSLLVCPAGPLELLLAPEPGVAAARLVGLRLRGDEHHFAPGDALPRRVYTGLDLRRLARRVADAAGSTYRSRADLAAFFSWIVDPRRGREGARDADALQVDDSHAPSRPRGLMASEASLVQEAGVTVEVEPMAGSMVGARACYEAWVDHDDHGALLDEPRGVAVSGPVRATPAEVLADLLLAANYAHSGEVLEGWSQAPLEHDGQDDPDTWRGEEDDEAGSDEDEPDDEP